MCYSETSSLVGAAAAVASGIVGYWVMKRYFPDKPHSGLVGFVCLVWGLTTASMQMAEAWMWKTYPEKEGCLAATRTGYLANTSQPVIFLLVGIWYNYTQVYRPMISILLGFALLLYVGVVYGYEAQQVFPENCTTLTTEDFLAQSYWPDGTHADVTLYFICMTLAIVSLPIRIPLLVLFYGTFALSMIMYNPEGVGSTWCFSASFVPLALLLGYSIFFIAKNK